MIFETVLFETEETPPRKLMLRGVTADDPTDQLLKVLPLMVFVGSVAPPSKFCQPVTAVLPETVMLEKLLLLLLMIDPPTEDELSK